MGLPLASVQIDPCWKVCSCGQVYVSIISILLPRLRYDTTEEFNVDSKAEHLA